MRRTAVLIGRVAEMHSRDGADFVTHALVAERAGVPVQYVRRKYPSRDDLMALAAD